MSQIPEVRRIQELPDKKGFVLNLPVAFCRIIGLKKSDEVNCSFENNRIIIEKRSEE